MVTVNPRVAFCAVPCTVRFVVPLGVTTIVDLLLLLWHPPSTAAKITNSASRETDGLTRPLKVNLLQKVSSARCIADGCTAARREIKSANIAKRIKVKYANPRRKALRVEPMSKPANDFNLSPGPFALTPGPTAADFTVTALVV